MTERLCTVCGVGALFQRYHLRPDGQHGSGGRKALLRSIAGLSRCRIRPGVPAGTGSLWADLRNCLGGGHNRKGQELCHGQSSGGAVLCKAGNAVAVRNRYLEGMVLSLLSRMAQGSYSYEIRKMPGQVSSISETTIYGVRGRLEKQGYIYKPILLSILLMEESESIIKLQRP